MDIETQIELIQRSPTEEVVTLKDLRTLLETNPHPNHYVGIEISGPLHIGSILINGFKINDFIRAGLKCKVFLADWHSYINNKLGGDWEKIQKAAKYYEAAFKFFCPGVEVEYGSNLYHDNDEYWKNVLRFAKQITLSRNVRCLTIMGRSEKEKLDFGQYLYPTMQAVDIWAMNLDVVHSGMDQRKVHMLARDVFPSLRWKIPIAIHHHLLPGLSEPERLGLDDDMTMDTKISSKMSKSKGGTAIFIHDTPTEIREKIRAAWCPEGETTNNPILEFTKHILFHDQKEIDIDRPQKYGGRVTYASYDEIEQAFRDRSLHPSDLKKTVWEAIDNLIDPLRQHFKGWLELREIFNSS